MKIGPDGRRRCGWVTDDPLYLRYHDEEWGVPVRDDRLLFEFLVLETFQAGLSWLTILRKREAFRRAFAGFDPEKVARFGERQVARLMGDRSIVRNRRKIEAAIANARAFLAVREAEGSFADWMWSFVEGRPIVNRWRRDEDVPAETPLSRAISRELRARGFRFVGPVVVYAHMQATGMVMDHVVPCFRHGELVETLARGEIS